MDPEFYKFPFITARKRGLGQGNVFRPVCHSVQEGGGLPSMHHKSHNWGGSAFKERGALHLGAGVCIQEVEKRAARILLECFLVFDCPQLNQQIV